MMEPELTVYIVEDSPAVMQRLLETVQDIPNARVVGKADTARLALDGVRQARPRVLILDMHLRVGHGFQVLRELGEQLRPDTVIVVTNYSSHEYRQASQTWGADHFFDKAQDFNQVRELLLAISGIGDEPEGSRGQPAQS